MRAAETLGALSFGRPHPLSGKRAGQYGIEVTANYRLVIEIAQEPVPVTADGGIDLGSVVVVRAVEVTDYHG